VPSLSGIIETCLYVEDTGKASRFYEEVLGLHRIAGDDRLLAYSVAGKNVLILFKRGSTSQPLEIPGGTIPPHDGSGQNHLAFAISAEQIPAWEKQFEEHRIAIESRVHWPLGGTSIYFRDPDDNLLELATLEFGPSIEAVPTV
jgi:catechol 2,3-dioxygenase-like lactoylglutathione lyase family enzyme